MLIHIHSQATTTPKVRAAIGGRDELGTVMAARFGVTPQAIYKWRKRDSVEDCSHRPHRLQTTLTPAQEAVAVALRQTLLVPFDDLLARQARLKHSGFKAYESGCIHIDVTYLP